MNQTTGSSLCLTYGIENCVNFVASAVVLWRFFAPTSLDDALERNLQHREQRANVALGAIIVGLGLCLAIASMVDLTRGAESNEELAGVFVVSFFSIWFFAVLTCFKFRYAVRLESHSLKKDGICSLIGTILALALLINTLIIAFHGNFGTHTWVTSRTTNLDDFLTDFGYFNTEQFDDHFRAVTRHQQL